MKNTRLCTGLIGIGMIAQAMHLAHRLSLPERFAVVTLYGISSGPVCRVADRA